MMKRKLLLIMITTLVISMIYSCGTKRGCDGKSKHRVEMGWM